MARGDKLAPKHKSRNKVQLKNKGSDGSDEDYKVGEDEEFDESEDEYFSSLGDDETEESLGEFEEEKELDVCLKKKIKKVGRPRGQKSSQRRNGALKPRKKNAAYSEEQGAGADFGVCRQKEEDFGEERPRNKTRVSSTKKNVDHCHEKPRKKTNVSYREENEDSDFDDSDEDEDGEFTPDEVPVVDDDEEIPVMEKNKVDRLKMQEAQIAKGKKRKRSFKALKRTRRKKSKKKQVLRRKSGYHVKVSTGKGPAAQKTKRSTGNGRRRRRRKLDVSSDSDFVTSGLSDYEYTISEEEKEQIREATEFCGRLTTSARSSSSLKMIKEEGIVPSGSKHPGMKDKDKMVDMKIEIGTQVCGICLSEEGKRTIRGKLNCCIHFFCFACIMEWSKVESRCPLCKQRFATISRTERVEGGNALRDVVIPVSERNQA